MKQHKLKEHKCEICGNDMQGEDYSSAIVHTGSVYTIYNGHRECIEQLSGKAIAIQIPHHNKI